MNLPIKIKNKTPWVSLNSYSSLLIDSINFDNYEVSEENSGPENYFGEAHIDNMVAAIAQVYPKKEYDYRDSLEVLFYNINKLLEGMLDYLFLTNPAKVEKTSEIDIILENAINKISKSSPSIWYDKLIKEDLIGSLSSSFLEYTMEYDTMDEKVYSNIIFKYVPEGTERKLKLFLKNVNVPEHIDLENPDLDVWGDTFINEVKASTKREWFEKYGWKESGYQRELYRSIMSGKGGITMDDYYVKSYNLMKYSGRLNTKEIETFSNFSTLENLLLNTYSPNIIRCLATDTYNNTTINPGFRHGISGWNRTSDLSSVTNSSYKSEGTELSIADTNYVQGVTDPELILDSSYSKFSQVNRVPSGLYKLTLSVSTTENRDMIMFLGDISVSLTVPQNTGFKALTLTDSSSGGIDLSSLENGILEYGFELLEGVSNSSTKIEYCRLTKIQ